MNKIKDLILQSKKIYAVLGVGIMICICVLTANISYGLGQADQQTYSEEYLQAYGLHVWAYTGTGVTQETASEWAKQTCDLLIKK